MKFIAIAAIAISAVSAMEGMEECEEGSCWVEGEGDEWSCMTEADVEADEMVECWDGDKDMMEHEAANTMLAGVATLALAATMAYWEPYSHSLTFKGFKRNIYPSDYFVVHSIIHLDSHRFLWTL